ncbi:tRNA (guanine(37)-N(1))-methyltransferase [Drosophila suzukii]|uniref:tRNA (Guanine(37)-N(1))-methyltransferase n=1 Tax=Drosophila suzukii TaxID=28584 RepID=A0AB40A369_DROSZ|nr:uncharacterized protein LOC108035660 [Drosophila biarmipes]XP_036670866.1 uncharacterized protein LOC108007113 [Drosophila suzukii]XP_037721603.1 uncharacterized protein LOC119554673 [Drosophila subpulchrella]XP_037728595.1 uncharacterized protein LOC119559630 [Drosophila subpulchrella]
MGRNKANNKKVTPGAAKPKTALNKSKKAKNVFKVADGNKGKGKKPKEVQGKLKQIKESVKAKQEKVDASLKTLHKDLVVKKPKAPVAPIKNNKKKGANAQKVSDTLGKLKF